MLKPLLFVSVVVLFGITASPAPGPMPQEASPQQPTPQEATPAPASSQKNPVKPTAQSRARAKEIYGIDCAVCHGDTGDGKTDLAKDMQLKLVDWTDSKTLAAKSDGELFNVIRNGKGKMPAEDVGRAKDHEVWSLILYIRGLPKQQPAAAPAPPASN